MKTVALIQARMGSTRLPGKVLMEIAGEPLLFHVVERVRRIRSLDGFAIATSTHPGDDCIEQFCHKENWSCFRGSENDVLDRFYWAAKALCADHVMRVTADCPLICPIEAERVLQRHLAQGADYTHNLTIWDGGMPLGTGTEVISWEALEISWKEGREPHHREHVNEYIYEHGDRFRTEVIRAPDTLNRPEIRLTVDTPEDLALIREIYSRKYRSGQIVKLGDAIALLDSDADLVKLNAHIEQKRY